MKYKKVNKYNGYNAQAVDLNVNIKHQYVISILISVYGTTEAGQ